MLLLRPSSREELMLFDQLDQQSHASKFIVKTGLDLHQKYFDDPAIVYLSIDDIKGELCGYLILVFEADTKSVEFRRILIDRNRLGVGQAAIAQMENYCKRHFNAERIWLDVYQDNLIGKHIYIKHGYKKFKEQSESGRTLEFYEKTL